jgi:preprotein translocase subunit SecD
MASFWWRSIQLLQRSDFMSRLAWLSFTVLFCGGHVALWPQDNALASGKKLADGVYAVLRDSLKEKDVLPLKNNETLAVHNHRYLKKDQSEPPRFLVVHSTPEVVLKLTGEPKVIKDGAEIARILLTLQPPAAQSLEKLTRENLGRPVAIVLGGEVVTMHKIRSVIKDGEVQITNCALGAADYLVKQLQAQQKSK